MPCSKVCRNVFAGHPAGAVKRRPPHRGTTALFRRSSVNSPTATISAAVTLGTYATQRDLPLIQGLSNWVAEQANVVAALTKPAGDTKYGHQPAGRIPTNQ